MSKCPHRHGRSPRTRQSNTPGARTLLQISVYDTGGKIPATLKKEELSQGAEKYLLDFLKGIERRRTNFVRGDALHLTLGGVPAAKVSWNGDLQGMPTNGVMYCVIVGQNVISFHTQDSGSEPTAAMRLAMKSIESMRTQK